MILSAFYSAMCERSPFSLTQEQYPFHVEIKECNWLNGAIKLTIIYLFILKYIVA